MPLQQVYPVSLRNGESFCSKLIFCCRFILGASVHEKKFQIGPTVLALKLDKGRMLTSITDLVRNVSHEKIY